MKKHYSQERKRLAKTGASATAENDDNGDIDKARRYFQKHPLLSARSGGSTKTVRGGARGLCACVSSVRVYIRVVQKSLRAKASSRRHSRHSRLRS